MSTISLQSKYMRAVEFANPSAKTRKWTIRTLQGGTLGVVHWYSGWRRYVFTPGEGTEFDAACLVAIAAFIQDAMRAHNAPVPLFEGAEKEREA